MNNLFLFYADFDNVMHKINTDRLQQRLQQLRDAGKKNAAAAQEVHLRLTAVLEKIDSEKQLDVNAINQELQSIGDVSMVLLVLSMILLRPL